MTDRRTVLKLAAGAAGTLGLLGHPALSVGQSADVSPLRDELMELETASWGFMKDKNFQGMRGFMAEDGLAIMTGGVRFNRRQMLALMEDFSLLSLSIDNTYAVRLITPDVATLLYRATYTSQMKGGKKETVTVLASSIYARRDNKWWSVLYQETAVT